MGNSAAVAAGHQAGADLALAEAALEELRTAGRPGDRCVALLRRLGRQCVARRSFPPPDGYAAWTPDAVDDLLARMFAREGEGHRFVLNCYLKATGGASLERLLLAAIDNFLKDQAKGTERGKLRRRLEKMLREDARFALCEDGRWALTAATSRVWQGDLAQLESAAWAVRGISITRWNTSGPTRADTKDALLTITQAVLEAADGSVRAEDLARLLQARFSLLRPARYVALDADEGWAGDQSTPVPAALTTEAVDARAREVWSELTPGERRLLPLLGDAPQRWADELQMGVNEASAIATALKEKLRVATADDPDHDRVVLGLMDLSLGATSTG